MSQKPSSLENDIKARALSLGFSICGITTPGVVEHHQEYMNWLERGLNADMTYLASPYHVSSRKQPANLLPGATSIIVLGLSYPLHTPTQMNDLTGGLISGYASGEDYHTRIPRMVNPLMQFISGLNISAPAPRVYTDSAPILERELAVRAGLGWIGRNSCLISPALGSNLILAEIFTAIPLVPDPPYDANHCGNCTRCIDSCPTGCILPDRKIDANHCLSYHSIENKGSIPPAVMEKLGTWIFGCDTCQMVCPWNQRPNRNLAAQEKANQLTVDEMLEFLESSLEDFRLRFGETALARTRFNGLRRNVIIRLANLGEIRVIPSLKKIESATEPTWLQQTAQWARERFQYK